MIFYFYTLSLLFLPFDFFTFYEQNSYGTTWTLSKILQMTTYLLILVKIVIDKNTLILRKIIFSYELHKYFIIFLGFVILVSFIGALNNNYHTILNSGNFNLKVRPVKEILILFHQYFFFIVLAPIIINNKSKIKILMQLLFWAVVLNLFFAFIDYGLKIYHIDFINRHFVDDRDVGQRLHGLFGEPRDAYVGLIFSLCFMHVYKNYFDQKLSSVFPTIILLSLVLTFSTSAFVGGFLYIVIIFLLNIYILLKYQEYKIKTWIFFIFLFLMFTLIFNSRNYIYILQLIETFLNTLKYYNFNNLEYFLRNYLQIDFNSLGAYQRQFVSQSPLEANIPHAADKSGTGLSAHVVNLLPFLDYIDRIHRVEIWSFLSGTGAGTTSIFFNQISGYTTISNPHSQIVKILYEYGIIGTILYIYSLLKIVIDLSKNISLKSQHLIFGSFIMLGVPVLINNNYMLYMFLCVLMICYYVDEKRL
jgi:hypothetical protein